MIFSLVGNSLRAMALLGILFSTAAKADVYRVLNDGPQALQARIDAIQQAQSSIDLQYYHWADDVTGRQIFALLKQAAERKVKVRIIIDSKHSKLPAALRDALAHSTIEVRDYLPFHFLRPYTWIHSMHNKLMITDNHTLIMGGRNMDSGYFELPARKKFHDRDVLIEGLAVDEAKLYFEQLWASADVGLRPTSDDAASVGLGDQFMSEALAQLSHDQVLHLNTGAALTSGETTVNQVHFVHDLLAVKKNERPVRDQLYALAESANHSIVIEVAYLTVTRDLFGIFKRALDRGVHIRILTNSMQSNDVAAAQAAYMARRKALVRMGIEVWEYMSPTTLHIKSSVIDDRVAIIGSYNLDPVSKNLNSETVSYVEDSEVARDLKAAMDENLKFAAKIDQHGFPEGYTTRFPGSPWTKVFKTQLLRYLAVPLLKGFT